MVAQTPPRGRPIGKCCEVPAETPPFLDADLSSLAPSPVLSFRQRATSTNEKPLMKSESQSRRGMLLDVCYWHNSEVATRSTDFRLQVQSRRGASRSCPQWRSGRASPHARPPLATRTGCDGAHFVAAPRERALAPVAPGGWGFFTSGCLLRAEISLPHLFQLDGQVIFASRRLIP
jgi:hypothetical protein